MEKILLVINARSPDVFLIDLACRITNLAQTRLMLITNPKTLN